MFTYTNKVVLFTKYFKLSVYLHDFDICSFELLPNFSFTINILIFYHNHYFISAIIYVISFVFSAIAVHH